MTGNELLLWLSARQEGSWPQFRGAVETLDLADSAGTEMEDIPLPVHQRIRFNLERLCHVEFDAAGCEDRWRVVPPVLAISDHGSKATAILCGARTPKLLDGLQQAASGLSLEQYPVPNCPDVVRIHASTVQDLIELAQRASLQYQIDAPTALLSQLPRIDSLREWQRAQLPHSGKDWEVKRFLLEKKTMKWRTITLSDANASTAQGLFCFTRFQSPQYFLREGPDTIRVPGAIGKYRIVSRSRRRVLKYDQTTQQIRIPAILRPPLLTERALILCSGFPASVTVVHKRRWLTYRDVPEEIAGMVAEVLVQDLI